jgi:hypothetical protein
VLGIFPEGGIWDPAHMEAQLGVALISQRANAQCWTESALAACAEPWHRL